jgi:hypothetical protein
MDNRIYYGQYSLKHWLDLIFKGNIILPDYQRFFVWNESKVSTLIDTLKKQQFVPPITIGAFNEGGVNQNLILDGQQRLTSILLAYLGLYPDAATFKTKQEQMANENDDEEDEAELAALDDILNWDFRQLTEKGKNKTDILAKIIDGNYKRVNLQIDDDFLKGTFLGFSYLVPETDNQQLQQKYYSSVFRNINIHGQSLLPQESRASLYFLNKDLKNFFDPAFIKELAIKTFSGDNKADFVRFVALLSQFAKDGNFGRVARGYKPKMEKYYEEYIYSVVGEHASSLFKPFSEIFPDNIYQPRLARLRAAIGDLEIPKQFSSIIDMDMFLFGLFYIILFDDRTVDVTKKTDLFTDLQHTASAFKADDGHKRAPSALKYLKARMESSIDIYRSYSHE